MRACIQRKHDFVLTILFKNWPNTKLYIKVPFSDKRCNVINELLTTEQDYLENLELVRDYFIQPLTNQKVLEEDEKEIIFINWNDVLLCTNRFYKSLKIRRKMTMRKDINIGDILCENVRYFSSSDFCEFHTYILLFS
jgi:hypothetical protein